MKKLFALVLFACMLVSVLASCNMGGQKTTTAATTTAPTPGGTTTAPTPGGTTTAPTPGSSTTNPGPVDVPFDFDGGSITAVVGGAASGSVTTTAYAGIAGKDYTDAGYYTYNDYTAGMTGLNWNPHSWETNEDSYVLGWITMGFYDFVLNENADGYSIVPEMASKMPIDVTANYVGTYGVTEKDTAKAWRIYLNPNAKWDNGEAITAADYIYSMQQQLDPYMMNRRADSFYAGEFVIVKAKNYLYSKLGEAYSNISSLSGAMASGKTIYLDMDFYGLTGVAPNEAGEMCPKYVAIDDETLWCDPYDSSWVSAKMIYEAYFAPGMSYNSYAPDYLYTKESIEPATWDEVGLKAGSDAEGEYIEIILEAPMAQAEFYLPYNLSSTWLVYKPMYEACKTYFDKDNNKIEDPVANADKIASVTNDYCTTLEKTMGYGPYKLTYFEDDKQLTFERSENWYGYSDGKHLGQFQTDKISCQVIANHDTALMAFLKGEIDGIGLQSKDMEQYASSDYIQYTPESYTTKITFNTDLDSLLERGTGSQILVVKEFREAFSLAVDREAFTTAYTAAAAPGFGLLNYMYVYDPFTGLIYRDSDAAKQALVDLNGLTYGPDGDYETLDEAYAAMTGYDMEKAKALMQVAYDKAVAQGLYDGSSNITIEFAVYQAEEIYVNMFNFFTKAVEDACKGTDFEGKVSLTMKVDADYYETMYAGGTDIIFSTWGGAAMSPFGMLSSVYCDASDGSGNQMEVGFETHKIMVKFNINGKEVVASLKDWADWCNSYSDENLTVALNDEFGRFTDYDYDTQCAIFGKLEQCYLSYFTAVPMYYRQGASLESQKVNSGVDQYLQIVAYGGIRYITYNYTDTEWAAYVQSQGGQLTY